MLCFVLGFWCHQFRTLISSFSVGYNLKREEEYAAKSGSHKVWDWQQADPTWWQLVSIHIVYIYYIPQCTVSSADSVHSTFSMTPQNVILQKCDFPGRERKKPNPQLLQRLSFKVSNYNEKSNYLIWPGQKSSSSVTCPILWHEGWSRSFQKHLIYLLSHPIKPLSYSQTLV